MVDSVEILWKRLPFFAVWLVLFLLFLIIAKFRGRLFYYIFTMLAWLGFKVKENDNGVHQSTWSVSTAATLSHPLFLASLAAAVALFSTAMTLISEESRHDRDAALNNTNEVVRHIADLASGMSNYRRHSYKLIRHRELDKNKESDDAISEQYDDSADKWMDEVFSDRLAIASLPLPADRKQIIYRILTNLIIETQYAESCMDNGYPASSAIGYTEEGSFSCDVKPFNGTRYTPVDIPYQCVRNLSLVLTIAENYSDNPTHLPDEIDLDQTSKVCDMTLWDRNLGTVPHQSSKP